MNYINKYELLLLILLLLCVISILNNISEFVFEFKFRLNLLHLFFVC